MSAVASVGSLLIPRPSGLTLEARSEDPGQKVRPDGPGRLRVAGSTRAQSSHLVLSIGGQRLRVELRAGMAPAQTAEAIRNALPDRYACAVRLTSSQPGADAVVQIARAPSRTAANVPAVQVRTGDPEQHLVKTGKNELLISGNASVSGAATCVRLTVDGNEVMVLLEGGESPLATARKVQAALPRSYKATAHPIRSPGLPVRLRIVRELGPASQS